MCFNLYHAKEVQLFFGLGIYSGIFTIYLQSASIDSRTTTIVFYALCLLYILSTASVVSDLLQVILVNIDSSGVSNNSICKNIISLLAMLMRLTTLPVQLQNDLQSVLFRVAVIQQTALYLSRMIYAHKSHEMQGSGYCLPRRCTGLQKEPTPGKVYALSLNWKFLSDQPGQKM